MSSLSGSNLDAVRTRPGGRSARVRKAVLAAARSQLAEIGYSGLSPAAVASRSGVDRATIYRRWPTRARLAADAVLEQVGEQVSVEDTGDLEGDLRRFLGTVADVLSSPEAVRLAAALAAARAEDPELQSLTAEFWRSRFHALAPILRRGSKRDDLDEAETDQVIESLVAPLYFRALLSGRPIDGVLLDRCVGAALNALRSGPVSRRTA